MKTLFNKAIIIPNVKFNLSDLTCSSYLGNVTNILNAYDHVPNVISVELTFAEIKVNDDSKFVLDSVIEDIVDIGYKPALKVY